ncbi:MAG: PadR family transcriptional regulator [bacterium]|nr:PadR family transcriptional regulator [bacterium]
MREPTYFILTALLDGSLHGYGIIKRAEELSGGRIRLAAGTLYGALDRLVETGDIAVDREEHVSGRRRRYYRITERGEGAVAAEVRRMQSAIASAGTRAFITAPGVAT